MSTAEAEPSARFNFFVAGQRNLGKTTFICSLLDNVHSLSYKRGDLPVERTTEIQCVDRFTFVDAEFSTSLIVEAHDCPGYGGGDSEQYHERVMRFLSGRLEDYAHVALSNDPKVQIQDPRMHLCLYFIPSHRVSDVDESLIASIARLVNVVPVIAKADTMNSLERKVVFKEVEFLLQRCSCGLYTGNLPFPLEQCIPEPSSIVEHEREIEEDDFELMEKALLDSPAIMQGVSDLLGPVGVEPESPSYVEDADYEVIAEASDQYDLEATLAKIGSLLGAFKSILYY